MGTIGSIACLAMGNYSIFILSVITTLYSIIAGMNIHYLGFQLAAKLNTANLNSRALLPVARFLVIIVCITFFGRDLVTLYVSFMLGTLIIVGYQYYIYQAYVTHVEALRLPGDSTIQIVQSNNQEENATWLYFMSLASMCFFGFIQNNGEKLLLGAMLIPELMGVFSILNLTGYSMMFILLGFLTQSIMPSLFARTSDNIKESNWNSLLLLNKYIGIFALITFTCTVISFFTSSLFFHMILRTEYHDYASWHPWMVLAGGIFGISQLLLIPAQIVEQPNLQNNQRLINIVITLGLMTFSIAYLDFSGVLVSIVISNCLCLLVNGFFYVSILQRYKVRENAVKIELSFKRIA
jgi:O-antigen/teichoic acid export membrane protein